VLRTLRRRSLARLRKEVEPAPVAALARFLPAWQAVGSSAARGLDGVIRAVEQLQGALIPASALESLILPLRVADYSPALLDELSAAGEILWAGGGGLPGNDGWVTLALPETAPLLLPEPDDTVREGAVHAAVLEVLDGGQAMFFRRLSDAVQGITGAVDDATLSTAVWDLVWSGHLTNDTIAPLRVVLGGRGSRGGRASPRPRRSGRYGRPAMPSRTGPPGMAGRWSLLPERDADPTRRLHALTETLLDRHGIVTRGSLAAERVPGGFSAIYPVLRAFEDSGRCRRGYFVETLGAAQFAAPGAVDRMRALTPSTTGTEEPLWTSPAPGGPAAKRRTDSGAVVLAATDPANPYGAALPWPDRGVDPSAPAAGHKPGRKAGALVVLVDGHLTLYVERGGWSLLSWGAGEEGSGQDRLQAAADALALAVREGSLGRLAVERSDGASLLAADSPVAATLERAGFRPTPRGLRLRA
jgi:ATP-dependent Lhr-like helicase